MSERGGITIIVLANHLQALVVEERKVGYSTSLSEQGGQPSLLQLARGLDGNIVYATDRVAR